MRIVSHSHAGLVALAMARLTTVAKLKSRPGSGAIHWDQLTWDEPAELVVILGNDLADVRE